MNHHAFDGAKAPVLSSELLGFPADARVLIVNCDDLGMYEAINTAVIDSIERGIASSGSLMAPCPAVAASSEGAPTTLCPSGYQEKLAWPLSLETSTAAISRRKQRVCLLCSTPQAVCATRAHRI